MPAGLFQTVRVRCVNGRNGAWVSTLWYSPQVEHLVREESSVVGGRRVRELIAYRIRSSQVLSSGTSSRYEPPSCHQAPSTDATPRRGSAGSTKRWGQKRRRGNHDRRDLRARARRHIIINAGRESDERRQTLSGRVGASIGPDRSEGRRGSLIGEGPPLSSAGRSLPVRDGTTPSKRTTGHALLRSPAVDRSEPRSRGGVNNVRAAGDGTTGA